MERVFRSAEINWPIPPFLAGRIYNWKFDSALTYLPENAPEEYQRILKALASMLGDSGWMNGSIQEVASIAVSYLLGEIVMPNEEG